MSFQLWSDIKSGQPLSKAYITDGWVTGCSAPSNTAQCYNNGVGFIFQARPSGQLTGSHASFGDLSYQLWAYGTTITDAGGQYHSQISATPLSQYSLFIDGFGQAQSAYGQTSPYYARIFAYKDGPDYTYFAADGTNAYPTKDFMAGGMDSTPQSYFTLESHAPLKDLQKVQRHMLFVKNKYFVIFDDLASNKASTFSSLYPILENTVTFDNQKKTAFHYTSNVGKITGKNSVSDVTVYVSQLFDKDNIHVDDMTGADLYKNPIITTENYSGTGGDTRERTRALWFSNNTKQKSFHFLTVIYPQKPGTTAPTIERLDDYTAKVTANDGTGSVDIISFNPQTAAANGATILVDLSQLTPLPVVDDVTGTTVTSVAYVPPPVNQVIPPVANQVTSPVISPITPASVSDTTPPTISVSGGTSPLSAGSNSISLVITTNESAICKWGRIAGTAYSSLPNTFTTSNGTTHTTSITNLVEGANRIYIRCTDTATPPNANTTDTTVTITVSSPPVSTDNDNDGIPNTTDKCPNTRVGIAVNQKGCPLPRKTKFSTVTDLSNTDLLTFPH